jgi:Tfp pilus assembly protein PilF
VDALQLAPDRARAQAILGRWLAGQGRLAEAQPHLDAARQAFTDLPAVASLRELDSAPQL